MCIGKASQQSVSVIETKILKKKKYSREQKLTFSFFHSINLLFN